MSKGFQVDTEYQGYVFLGSAQGMFETREGQKVPCFNMESIAFPVLFQLLASTEGANVSRIDIACDDHAGYLSMDDVLNKVQANEVNSRMTARSTVISFNGTQRSGATAYIGAPSSDFRVRIYDKALEEGVDGHWVRVELVLRGKNSMSFVQNMTNSENVGKLAAQIINDKFSFIERDDSNITRCTVCWR